MSIVKSFSVGKGDMFYIKHGSDSFTIIDCCLTDQKRAKIMRELQMQSRDKGISRFISTHPDDDHICGLKYLNQLMQIRNFYCVKNSATKIDPSEDFREYCTLRDDSQRAFYLSQDCARRWLNVGDEQRDSAGIFVLWPAEDNIDYKLALLRARMGQSPNNISPILWYAVDDGPAFCWLGDLESEFMTAISADVRLVPTDIVIAPHHGRSTGKIPEGWLRILKPKLIVIGEADCEDLDYYSGYKTITQNSAGDITFECVSGGVHIHVSNDGYRVNFLARESVLSTLGHYIGTIRL